MASTRGSMAFSGTIAPTVESSLPVFDELQMHEELFESSSDDMMAASVGGAGSTAAYDSCIEAFECDACEDRFMDKNLNWCMQCERGRSTSGHGRTPTQAGEPREVTTDNPNYPREPPLPNDHVVHPAQAQIVAKVESDDERRFKAIVQADVR